MKPDFEDDATVARGINTLRTFAHKEEFKESGAEKKHSCDSTFLTRPELKMHVEDIHSKTPTSLTLNKDHVARLSKSCVTSRCTPRMCTRNQSSIIVRLVQQNSLTILA